MARLNYLQSVLGDNVPETNVRSDYSDLISRAESGELTPEQLNTEFRDLKKRGIESLKKFQQWHAGFGDQVESVKKAAVLRELYSNARSDAKFLLKATDIDILKDVWDREVRSSVSNVFGGKVPQDVDAYIDSHIGVLESKKQIAIVNKNQRNAFNELTQHSNNYRAALDEGNFVTARENYLLLQQTLNSFEEAGVFTSGFVSAIKKSANKDFNRRMFPQVVGDVETLEATSGVYAAKKRMGQYKNSMNLSALTSQQRAIFDKKDKLYNDKISNPAALTNNTVLSIRGNIEAGVGNVEDILKQVGEVKPRLKSYISRKKRLSGPGAAVAEENLLAEITAFEKFSKHDRTSVTGAPGNPSQRLFSPNTTTLDVISILGVAPGIEANKALNMVIKKRALYGYDRDPAQGVVNHYRMITGNPDNSSSITDRLEDELDIIGRVTGVKDLPKNTKNLVVETLNKPALRPEDTATKNTILNKVSGVDLVKEAAKANENINSINNGLVSMRGFLRLNPVDIEKFKVLYRSSGDFRSGVQSLTGFLSDDQFSETVSELQNNLGLNRESVILTLASDLAWQAHSGSGPMGQIGVAALGLLDADADSPAKDYIENLKDSIMKERPQIGRMVLKKGSEPIFESGKRGSDILTGIFGRGRVSQTFGDKLGDLFFIKPPVSSAGKGQVYNYLSEVTGISIVDLLGNVRLSQSSGLDDSYYLEFKRGDDVLWQPLQEEGTGRALSLPSSVIENIAQDDRKEHLIIQNLLGALEQ